MNTLEQDIDDISGCFLYAFPSVIIQNIARLDEKRDRLIVASCKKYPNDPSKFISLVIRAPLN